MPMEGSLLALRILHFLLCQVMHTRLVTMEDAGLHWMSMAGSMRAWRN